MDVERAGEIFASHPDKDESDQVYWREPLYTVEDEPRLSGEVSGSDDWYNVIQYGDVLEAVGQRLEHHDVEPEGHVTVSPSYHKMSAKIGLGETVEPVEGDEIDLQVHVRSGHSGFHGVKYEPGAFRQVCSNGLKAFVGEQIYEQTHSEAFQPGLAHHAVDSMIEGVDTVEQRLEEAQKRTLKNRDEALIVLHDLGIEQYLDNPTPDLITALNEEVEDPESPSLYETYNAATFALTHLAEDETPEYVLDNGFERAAELLEYGDGIPSARILGENAVQNRSRTLLESEQPDEEEYWEGETESVRELMEEHEIQA